MNTWMDKLRTMIDPHARAAMMIDDGSESELQRSPPSVAWLERHLGSCAKCREMAETRKKLIAEMRALPTEHVSAGFAGRVLLAAKTRKAAPEVDDRDEAVSWIPRSQL